MRVSSSCSRPQRGRVADGVRDDLASDKAVLSHKESVSQNEGEETSPSDPLCEDANSDALDYRQAAHLLGLRTGTLYSLVCRRRIPHLRYGKRLVRFSRRALQAWMRGLTVPAKESDQ